jgi:hypothetical protein
MIEALVKEVRESAGGRPVLERKKVEKETCFLNHLAMTLDVVTPFLKGFYLALNSWRPKRNEGDWKMSDKRWKGF